MKLFLMRIKLLFAMIITIFLRIFFFFVPNGKHWVIMERGIDARDNGYCFYKYLKNNHPQKKVYYAIEKSSADYIKVKEDAVEPYSLKYYWLVFTCEKYISTHYNMIVKNLYKFRQLSGIHKKYCFLQHGIIGNYPKGLCKDKFTTRLFICGALSEYNFVLNNFGHSHDVVKYTGLARFDSLHDHTEKRQILVMPTWRAYIDNFEESQYFNEWNSVLNDKKLNDMLLRHDIKLIFYPHINVQKYLHHFKSENKNVIIASFNEYDVQTLLKESAVLITDFSSIHYDFAYMKKPLVYFQFDKEAFFAHHYQVGHFDCETMGFGKVCITVDELVEEISKIIDNNMCIDELYLKRTENFFALHDNHNCERIYNEIINMK